MEDVSPRAIISVGAIVTRVIDENQQVLLIKRDRYGTEWSFPKGKVEIGENLDEAFDREMKEEIGFSLIKDEYAGCVSYPTGGDIKVNLYWYAKVSEGAFSPNEEVKEIKWLDKKDAIEQLSYNELKDFLNRKLQ